MRHLNPAARSRGSRSAGAFGGVLRSAIALADLGAGILAVAFTAATAFRGGSKMGDRSRPCCPVARDVGA